MAFFVFVNGNRLHDEGAHDSEMRVIRKGGGPMVFATLADAEAFAQQKYEEHVKAFADARRWPLPRDRFIAASEPPSVPDQSHGGG